ncbi:hypothetical protein DY78_GL000009 [Lactiplantibacillus fabifermentans DSM 21115]|uniref:Uncharacterized protein n=1 Tax=Lactiplantibacillus fabifermentans DSM 21115 TaxID=1413187 RepID=A0A0R2NUM4_9LACO|nr:hypothetical protein DY78_GL000009 [Lactiplantibacillus fabifermentans DSM 21115]
MLKLFDLGIANDFNATVASHGLAVIGIGDVPDTFDAMEGSEGFLTFEVDSDF